MANWFKKDFYSAFFSIFALVGLITGLIAAFIWFQTNRLTRDGIRTVGTVVELVGGKSVAPRVEFQTEDGQRQVYTSDVYSSPPAYELGEKVTLWYTPGHPDQVVLSGLSRWFIPLLMGFFFLIFGGIGFGGLFYQFLKKRDQAWLKLNGQEIVTTSPSVVLNTSVRMNGRSPYALQCQWQDPATGQVHVFESEPIWFDPTPYMPERPLRVMIEPGNPRKFYVDVSFLPEAA